MSLHTDHFGIGNMDALAGLLQLADEELLDVKVAAPKPRKDPKDIWDIGDVTDAVEDDVDDSREVPEYEFVYSQAVESTDTFLGMSGKDPSSTCCEDIVVKVHLPKEKSASGLDLDVKPTHLKLTSSIYKLSIYLPHKVQELKGSAKFDSDKKTLSIKLPIVRNLEEELEKMAV